jgi:hypothetical protein
LSVPVILCLKEKLTSWLEVNPVTCREWCVCLIVLASWLLKQVKVLWINVFKHTSLVGIVTRLWSGRSRFNSWQAKEIFPFFMEFTPHSASYPMVSRSSVPGVSGRCMKLTTVSSRNSA